MPLRIILFTGKGGVGKTCIAAATALKCSKMGYKTLVISTDAAHSLADSFDLSIGDMPTYIKENLYGQELDVNEEIKRNWGPIQGFVHDFLHYKGFDGIIAEELAVFPGMEEIFSLLVVKGYYDNSSYDTVIIDCAPTADTLRLLAGPDMAKWYMEKVFNIERRVFKAVRPVAKKLVGVPLPTDDVFGTVEGIYRNLIDMKNILTDREHSSIRLVVNPEKMVIKESQRAYTLLNLFGYGIDAVIVNRLLPENIQDPYYKKWKEFQKLHFIEIQEAFSPLPILTSRLLEEEIVGKNLLEKLGEEIYKDLDPTQVFFKEKPMEIIDSNAGYNLLIRLPFATKENLQVWSRGGELTVKFKNFKRSIVLPRALVSLKIEEAKLEEKTLRVTFKKGGR